VRFVVYKTISFIAGSEKCDHVKVVCILNKLQAYYIYTQSMGGRPATSKNGV